MELEMASVEAPVSIVQVIMPNVCDSGTDIRGSRSLSWRP
jgi:CxxC motif-containing protein